MTDHTREPDAPGDTVHPDPEAPNWTGDTQPDDALSESGPLDEFEAVQDADPDSESISPAIESPDPDPLDEPISDYTPVDVSPADAPSESDISIANPEAVEQLDVSWEPESTTLPEGDETAAQDTSRIPPVEPITNPDSATSEDEQTTTPPVDSSSSQSDAKKNETKGGAAGFFARLGIGDRFRQATSAASDATSDLGETGSKLLGSATKGRTDGFRGFLDPSLHLPNLIPHTRFVITAVILGLFMLMANSAGAALIVISAMVPILIVMALTQHDVFEKESNLYIASVTVLGVVVGGIIGWLSSIIVRDQWFDGGEINFGAGGFGGRFAEAAGNAPFLVTLLCGLVLPAAGIAGMGAVPILLRRWPQFRNEVMDGMIMAGASAAGFSIGLSLVMWWPMIGGDGPQTSVSDWTYMIIGSVVLRPLVLTLSGAMIGAGVWRYMMSNSTSLAMVPAVGGILGILLLTIGSVQLQSVDMWAEFLWTVVLAALVFVVYRRVLDQAITTDQQVLGQSSERVVCPNCRRVTPVGAFCALCGKPLPASNASPDDSTPDPEAYLQGEDDAEASAASPKPSME